MECVQFAPPPGNVSIGTDLGRESKNTLNTKV
jgi:hypothetical protein